MKSHLAIAWVIGLVLAGSMGRAVAAGGDTARGAGAASEAFARETLVADWELQDGVRKSDPHAKTPPVPYAQAAEKVLAELSAVPAPLNAAADALKAKTVSDAQWKDFYLAACARRRLERMKPYLGRMRQVIFLKRTPDSRKPYDARRFSKGIYLLTVDDSAACRVEPLTDHEARDPDVSFDGARVLFAGPRGICELDLAGRQVRPITDAGRYVHRAAIYLPDGRILFASTECRVLIPCNGSGAHNYYACDADGRITFDQADNYYPALLPDGRVLYTSWRYNDKTRFSTFDLFTMNADGASQMGFFGTGMRFPSGLFAPRPIPGSHKVLAVISGKEDPILTGPLAILDPAREYEADQGLRRVGSTETFDLEALNKRHSSYGGLDKVHRLFGGPFYAYPFPLDEDGYLASAGTARRTETEGKAKGRSVPHYSLFLVLRDGRRELLAAAPETDCVQARVLSPLPGRPPVLSGRMDASSHLASCYVQDVYAGVGLAGVPRGTVKRLRVVALQYRGGGYAAVEQERVWSDHWMGGSVNPPDAAAHPHVSAAGAWDVKVVLGTAPVEADGSAAFLVPANLPVYFQALDERGYVVQGMRDWATFMPGERVGCVGCHERRTDTPAPRPVMAATARLLDPFHGPPRGFSYLEEVQPIWNKHCVRCHDGKAHDGKVLPDLGGIRELDLADRHGKVKTRRVCMSYDFLAGIDIGRERKTGKKEDALLYIYGMGDYNEVLPPSSRGAAKSRLLKMLTGGHGKVALSKEELEKVACWIDLNAPFKSRQAPEDPAVVNYRRAMDGNTMARNDD
jgi:hypothetical protein